MSHNVIWGLGLLLVPVVSPSPAIVDLPKGKYTRHRGYLSQGADLVNGSMTLPRAQGLCDSLPECSGITFAAEWDALPKEGTKASDSFRAHVWLKGFDEWVPFNGHVTLIKQLQPCANTKYLHFQRPAYGPMCCEGKGCPNLSEYAAAEVKCRLPAATPFGVPLCSNLRGESLPNVAALGKASASSEYPYAENAGPSAANDGVVNGKMFHSQCENGPQWWRVELSEPMVRANASSCAESRHGDRL